MISLSLRLGLLCVALLVCTPVKATEPEVSASELARHLGVRVWRISAANLPKRFTARIDLIQNGAVVNWYMGPHLFSRKGDLVILSRETERGRATTMMCGDDGVYSPANPLQPLEGMLPSPIPKDAGLGSYVLYGDYWPHGDLTTATGKIEDLKGGLVLHITNKSY